ncbi:MULTISPECIES: cob(I)yrinic acid a,c-diamide adenosyltransferase [Methylococcus]|jgi:cob(I)alamin adenosyltransferase|uniref:Corrinoid adenosyltransferase n=2 Tax=Methylococcus capsulatus TaxID=414 RepID=Q607E6_METCA|nr:cob(I)yrinic acid a,c-diamide adenosyltransferase [Methylococcus capsulatus]AAU92149.1 putative ATP:cob(I)alamin adenosyltransferase [Methylococcus capsulatus str. Bath]QXP91108.1 cob(I)yrinic acid a,c-diamide adenosyltransferase [Methylococcus capsulatus]QXP92722.1 cob(I)yrinic acid a,c-diamide adenosyltransferase [Methylococcus capsulatus]CAI8868088.1 Cobalamin adenosyltransferase [Methylococcus capsulatus]
MGNRLTRIYTRTGDDGTTGLGDGCRTGKDSLRIEACGTVDELNSVIGLVLTQATSEELRACLVEVQQTLFDLGGELSLPGQPSIQRRQTEWLEVWLNHFNARLPPLEDFVLPGGSLAAAHCHVARTVCRRAERRLVALARGEAVNPESLAYLNRLSDFLFVVARMLARMGGHHEPIWHRDREPPRPRVDSAVMP